MGGDTGEQEPWLPVPVLATLYLGSVLAGALATAALVESPAMAVALLRDPVFYVLLAVGGGGGLLIARTGWRE